MPWFTYSQNNSGGAFSGPAFVIVEALSAAEAEARAIEHNVYFDGVAQAGDCECCGDRWYRAYDEDATDEPRIYAQSPEMYPFEPGDSVLIVPTQGDAYTLPKKT